jgi:hypothetical protein
MRASRQLQSPPAHTAMVEVDDIGAVDPLPQPSPASVLHAPALDDIVEIELTAEQMDALLSDAFPPARG